MAPAVCVLQALWMHLWCLCVWLCVFVPPSGPGHPPRLFFFFLPMIPLKKDCLGGGGVWGGAGWDWLLILPQHTQSGDTDYRKISYTALLHQCFWNQRLRRESESGFGDTKIQGWLWLRRLYCFTYHPSLTTLSLPCLFSFLYVGKSQSKTVSEFHPTVPIRSKRWIWVFKMTQSLQSYSAIRFFPDSFEAEEGFCWGTWPRNHSNTVSAHK